MNAFVARVLVVALFMLGPLVLDHLKVDGRADMPQDARKRRSA